MGAVLSKNGSDTLGSPTFIVDGISLDDVAARLGLTDEQTEALRSLQSDVVARGEMEARERAEAYQSEQADALKKTGSWEEVDCQPAYGRASFEEEIDRIGFLSDNPALRMDEDAAWEAYATVRGDELKEKVDRLTEKFIAEEKAADDEDAEYDDEDDDEYDWSSVKATVLENGDVAYDFNDGSDLVKIEKAPCAIPTLEWRMMPAENRLIFEMLAPRTLFGHVPDWCELPEEERQEWINIPDDKRGHLAEMAAAEKHRLDEESRRKREAWEKQHREQIRESFELRAQNQLWADFQEFRFSMIETPTVHQFYDDLFGASLLDTAFDDRGLAERPATAILVNHRDREEPYQLYTDYRSFIEGVEKETSFIHMGHFWVPPTGHLRATKNAMTDICGFAVDIDRVEDESGSHYAASAVMEALLECLDSHPEVRPNYIMLSGTGIQLWYVFGKAIPLLSAGTKKGRAASPRRSKFDQLLKKLYGFFKDELPPNRFKVDTACAAINHAFRAPDSPTKLHYQTRLFAYEGRRRQPVDPLALSDFLGGGLEPYDVEDWDQEAYERIKEEKRSRADGWWKAPATEKQVEWLEKLKGMHCVPASLDTSALTKADADAEIKKGEVVYTRHSHFVGDKGYVTTTGGHTVRLSPRNPGLYEFTVERIESNTPVGSRYWSLFALAGLAYNCGIPKKRLEADMTRLVESDWGKKVSSDRQPMTRKDVQAALKGYCALGTLRPKEQVEGLLAWAYGPSQPRNGRTRADHLWGKWTDADGHEIPNKCKIVRDAALDLKRKSQAADKVAALADWLRGHPAGSKRSACADLGMSRTTVMKYWQEACVEAGVADVRTGNHRAR